MVQSPSPLSPPVSGDERTAGLSIRPIKIAHIGLFVRDLARSVAFYEAILGFQVSDWVPGSDEVFMRLTVDHPTDHHVLALFPCAVPDAPDIKAGSAGPTLAHVAFALQSYSHLRAAAAFLRQRDIPFNAVRGGAGGHRRLYFHDPDGHMIELYVEMAQIAPDGQVPPVPHQGVLDLDADVD